MKTAVYRPGWLDESLRGLFGALPDFVEVVTPDVAGEELAVVHGLGRVPIGAVVVKGDPGGSSSSGDGNPAGTVIESGRSTAPTGYLACNGAAVSRTTYAELFAAIGTAFGAGDLSTTFNVPDRRGRAGIGAGTGSGLTARTLAAAGGAETHQLTVAELAAHTHTYNSYLVTFGFDLADGGDKTSGPIGSNTGSTGGDAAHNNMQPFVVMNYFIKYAEPSGGGGGLDLTPDTEWTAERVYLKFAAAGRELTLAVF